MVHEKNNTHLKRTQNVKKRQKPHFMGYFLGEGVPFWYTNPQYKGVGYPKWYTIKDYMGCRGDFNTPQKYTIIQKKTIKGYER